MLVPPTTLVTRTTTLKLLVTKLVKMVFVKQVGGNCGPAQLVRKKTFVETVAPLVKTRLVKHAGGSPNSPHRPLTSPKGLGLRTRRLVATLVTVDTTLVTRNRLVPLAG